MAVGPTHIGSVVGIMPGAGSRPTRRGWGAKGIGLARSRGPDFNSWTKLEANPVVKSTEWGVTEARDPNGKTFFYGSADPSNIWKKGGRYYMLTGNLLVLR